MKCPRCNEHNLRNRLNKHGKRTRYCKGCGWEKIVVEKMADDVVRPDDKPFLGNVEIPADTAVLPKKRGLMSKVKGLFKKD